MTSEQSIAFFIFSLVAAITPGPSNVMITATGSAVGVVRGLACVLGASLGMGLLLFCASMGLGHLVLGQPMILKAMNWVGAAFLLWLAWRIVTAGPMSEARGATPVGFLGAALLQWVNPKGWLVAVGAASTFLQGTGGNPVLPAAAFGMLFFAAAFPSGLAWLVLGALLRPLLRDHRTARIFNTAMGAALAASVVMFLR
jgi:threonine/homoserine/homoserine lactone efflux protein